MLWLEIFFEMPSSSARLHSRYALKEHLRPTLSLPVIPFGLTKKRTLLFAIPRPFAFVPDRAGGTPLSRRVCVAATRAQGMPPEGQSIIRKSRLTAGISEYTEKPAEGAAETDPPEANRLRRAPLRLLYLFPLTPTTT